MTAKHTGPMWTRAGRPTLALLVFSIGLSFDMTFPWSCWAQVDKLPEVPGRIGVDPRSGVTPDDTPDIFGPGKVSTVGNMWVKTTNIGVIGNPFTAVSSDPSAQWPGASGVEHLFFVGLFVGAKDASVSDPALLRRVSHNTEWRPPSLAPEDRIYQSFDGQVNGNRLSDDDSDGLIDEDRLDGHDNDGDGAIDEDYAAISQLMYTCILRDDTDEAINTAFAEKHVPRNLEVQQSTYTFSVPGANDFTSFEFVIENVGPNTLDSVYVGFLADLDCGPVSLDRYFADDLAEPRTPQGPDPSIDMDPADPDNPNRPYLENVSANDPRFQNGLCAQDTIHVSGFSLIDDDGDQTQTRSASTFVLLGHTLDPTGQRGPRRTGFRMYYWYPPGTPFTQGGAPTNDLERYQTISSTRGIDAATGLINMAPPLAGDSQDYRAIASVGPYLDMKPGDKVTVAFALAAQQIDYTLPIDNIADRYPFVVENAVSAVKTYRGTYEVRPGVPSPGEEGFGQETALIAEPGQEFRFSDCHDDSSGTSRTVRDDEFTWFDLDCNYCTGVAGHALKRWVASSPPPNPNLETVPKDRAIGLHWDNLSEYTLDPAKGIFDFKGYKIWKASNWKRPTGSTGPGDDLWALVGTYFWYDELDPLIEEVYDGSTGETEIIETPNVLLNRLTGEKIFPQLVPCLGDEDGMCLVALGNKPTVASNGGDSTITNYEVTKYPVGRYEWDDTNVLNGFVYFYAVTAFDSTGKGAAVAKLEGRPAATEGDAELPQGSLADGSLNDGNVFAVPNPYRGRAQWDLNPSAGDPTGTHIDFYNMPAGSWTMRIYTVSGDLVQEIRSSDLQLNGKPQQETSEDGQASWNLITRNGQEVVSGIYLFSVEGAGDTQQGKFVVIR